jgi:hypothetical protein
MSPAAQSSSIGGTAGVGFAMGQSSGAMIPGDHIALLWFTLR